MQCCSAAGLQYIYTTGLQLGDPGRDGLAVGELLTGQEPSSTAVLPLQLGGQFSSAINHCRQQDILVFTEESEEPNNNHT